MNGLEIALTSDDESALLQLDVKTNDGIIMVDFDIRLKNLALCTKVNLDVHFPFEHIHSCWTPCMHGHPKSIRNKGIPEWWPSFSSHISSAAPVGVFYSIEGRNRLSFALSEAKEIVAVHAGALEERRAGRIRFQLLESKHKILSTKKGKLRLDIRNIPFHQSIQSLTQWYEEISEHQVMKPPEEAFEPVYSTWYAFHQNLFANELEKQCEKAVALGCRTIILDDGWQTDDNSRGYRYCGDWNVAETRFPDMRNHIKKVRNMGLKYMFWLSVPFVGKKADSWLFLKDYLLFYSEQNQTGVIDPRYPNVREYLVATFARIVKYYDLDGVKLDFIDEFDLDLATGKALEPDNKRDTESVPEAVRKLMVEIKSALISIKSEILVEFRQRYVGPEIRKFGNIFRVHDCPNDSIMNRMSIMDLRLFSGSTAVHSDMFIWSETEPVESASLHFINTLFSVPQISHDLLSLSHEHLSMVRHWLQFWRTNKNILMNGRLTAESPEMQYPLISATKNRKRIISLHADIVCNVFDESETELTLVNGGLLSKVTVRSYVSEDLCVEVRDCLGELVSRCKFRLEKGIFEFSVPKSGYIKFTIEP
ncbi:hypothetical protein RJ43_12460 [Alteromonas macleodii]|nr:hypothetical protein RJ43_12460 [Alteromonas macleodii]